MRGVVPVSLNSRRAMDRRWLTHHRNVTHGFMIAQVQIVRASEPLPVWNPQTGELEGGDYLPIWSGRARLQSNKDWRARYVQSANNPEIAAFIRVQIPLSKDGPVPHFKPMDMIFVQPPDPASEWRLDLDQGNWTLRLRNALNSSNPWLRNLLAVVDIGEEPNNYDGAPEGW